MCANVLPPIQRRVGLVLLVAGPDALVTKPADLRDAGRDSPGNCSPTTCAADHAHRQSSHDHRRGHRPPPEKRMPVCSAGSSVGGTWLGGRLGTQPGCGFLQAP
jgi:hypothetical protein